MPHTQHAHTVLPLGIPATTFDQSGHPLSPPSAVVPFVIRPIKIAAIKVTVKLCCVADPFNRSCPSHYRAPALPSCECRYDNQHEWRMSNLISWLRNRARTRNGSADESFICPRRQSAGQPFVSPFAQTPQRRSAGRRVIKKIGKERKFCRPD